MDQALVLNSSCFDLLSFCRYCQDAPEVTSVGVRLQTTLGAPTGLLDEAYDLTLEVELLMSDQGLSWAEAQKRV